MDSLGTRSDERYYTVKEAASDYFQGKVSEREVYALFAASQLRGFRVGTGRGKILIYGSSLEEYRRGRETGMPAAPELAPAAPAPPKKPRRGRYAEPAVRLSQLPEGG